MNLTTKTTERKHISSRRKMVYLDVSVMPDDLTVDELDNYTNINDTTLNKQRAKKFDLVFGKAINIQRAIDYAVYPKMLPDKLMSVTLSPSYAKKLEKTHTTILNYWAYVGYLIIERIEQDSVLKDTLLEGKDLIDVEVSKGTSFRGATVTIIPNRVDTMYIGVIRVIVAAMREGVGKSDVDKIALLNKAIHSLKGYEDLSVFHGMGFTADYL